MAMDVIEIVYLICFCLGVGFALLSGILSGVFSGGAEAHAGGSHADLGHGHGGDGSVHFPILSPVTIAMFIATFGGTGMIFKKVAGWPALLHIPAAAGCAAGVALAVAWVMYKVFSVTQGSSEGRAEDAVGLEAEVTVPIPHAGLGEIAYTLKGTRYTNPAKTEDGKELPAQAIVRIMQMAGSTYIVRKLS